MVTRVSSVRSEGRAIWGSKGESLNRKPTLRVEEAERSPEKLEYGEQG